MSEIYSGNNWKGLILWSEGLILWSVGNLIIKSVCCSFGVSVHVFAVVDTEVDSSLSVIPSRGPGRLLVARASVPTLAAVVEVVEVAPE